MKIFTAILMSMLIAAPALAADPKVQELKALYNELLAFKDDEAFKRYGFAESCELIEGLRDMTGEETRACTGEIWTPKYHRWLDRLDVLKKHEFTGTIAQMQAARGACTQLRLLAMEYKNTHGAENDYTRYAREYLDRQLRELNDE